MNTIRHYLLLIICGLFCMPATADNKEMPIIAYYGVPDWQTTEENFRIFRECGFTVSLYPYSSLNLLIKACRCADKYGVKIIGRCPEMISSPADAAQALKKETGFYGYMMQDEPSAPEIRERQKEIERIKQFDSTHCFYINLHPYYHKEWLEPTLKVKTYPEYLRVASSTSCQQISFDFYPITTNGLRPTWYHNLEMIRQESLRTGKPFWGFVLSMPHDVPYTPDTYYPTPTLAALRLQVYANLAYGAQAIQYFTYWTPQDNPDFHFHDAPISSDGKKTQTYKVVQKMNQELKVIGRLFYGAKVISVRHLGKTIPEGTTRQATLPVNIKSLKVIGRQGAIISQFQKDGHLYMGIVNKSHEGPLNVNIQQRNSIPKCITKDLKEEELKTSYKVSAGDILLVKLK